MITSLRMSDIFLFFFVGAENFLFRFTDVPPFTVLSGLGRL